MGVSEEDNEWYQHSAPAHVQTGQLNGAVCQNLRQIFRFLFEKLLLNRTRERRKKFWLENTKESNNLEKFDVHGRTIRK